MRLPFNTPYRWIPRCWWANLTHIYSDLTHGVANVIRWIPVIWFDRDYDWTYLAQVMEYKLRRSAKYELAHGHHSTSLRDGRQQLICAELLKRLIADEYADGYKEVPKARMTAYFKAATLRAENDQRYLGLLLGKYLRNWWD